MKYGWSANSTNMIGWSNLAGRRRSRQSHQWANRSRRRRRQRQLSLSHQWANLQSRRLSRSSPSQCRESKSTILKLEYPPWRMIHPPWRMNNIYLILWFNCSLSDRKSLMKRMQSHSTTLVSTWTAQAKSTVQGAHTSPRRASITQKGTSDWCTRTTQRTSNYWQKNRRVQTSTKRQTRRQRQKESSSR